MGGMKRGFGETGIFFEGKERLVFGQCSHDAPVSHPGQFRQGFHPVKKCLHLTRAILRLPGLEIPLASPDIGFRGLEELINRGVFAGEKERRPPCGIRTTILAEKPYEPNIQGYSPTNAVMNRI